MADKKRNSKINSTGTRLVFEFERHGNTLVVMLAGEADLFGSSELRQGLADKLTGIDNIIFDLSGLEFADSYFLRLLIKLRKQLGGVSSVKVNNARPNVRRIFEITGLDKLFM